MSNPEIIIHVSSKLSTSEIAGCLGIKPPSEGHSEQYFTALCGPISVEFREPWLWELSNEKYNSKTPWTCCINLACSWHWCGLRNLFALEICSLLHSEAGGYFFAAFDTGDACFVLGDEGLWLPNVDREYFSRYPMPFEKYSFCELLPIESAPAQTWE